ncbi:MAG: hypothetical protein CBC84_000475 [Pelagibacteraceae bacterium TMED124]|nr:hypothetical protein [Candidatus Neomarinimicrobiota bacterium]RPG19309.1 MAG: hypothetical protein CBC84_000475 [Pelagibacteraceae bacterium TMED124]
MFKTYNLYIFLFILNLISLGNSHAKNIECSICSSNIKSKEYLIDIWGNPFHISHQKEGIFCECCSRIISKKITNGGYQLNDGRYICSLCDASIIKNDDDINNSFIKVQKKLYKEGLEIDNINNIEVKLINRSEMKKYYNFNENNHLQGITKISIGSDKIFKIFILNNTPKIQFEATLAHELLHVWLYENNIKISDRKMEAFCNLGTYLMYEEDGTKFSKIHIMSLENKNKNMYVTEYKVLKSLMDKHSFRHILNNIKTIEIK